MDRLPLLPYAVRCGALLLALAFVLNAAAFAAQSTDGGVKRVLVISTGSRLAPGFVMVDQHLLHLEPGGGEGGGDRGARDDRDVVLRRGPAEQDDHVRVTGRRGAHDAALSSGGHGQPVQSPTKTISG